MTVAVLLTGCSSGGSSSSTVGPQAPAAAGSTTATTTATTSAAAISAAPSTPAATSAAPAASPTSAAAVVSSAAPVTTATSAAPTSTKATTAPATTPAGGGTKSTAINPEDPAVKTAHAWFAQVGKAINAKKYETSGLDTLMTAAFRTRLKVMFSRDIGSYYPGPFPSQFVSESSPSPGVRHIDTCDVLDGFAQNPKTHKPAHSFVESAGEARLVLQKGRWVMNDWIDAPDHHSCTGVKVATPSW